MFHHLRLTFATSIALLLSILIAGTIISYQQRAELQRQIAALHLTERSLIEHNLIHEAGGRLIASAAQAARSPDPLIQKRFEESAAQALAIAADLQLPESSPGAQDLGAAIKRLEQSARATVAGAPNAAPLSEAQAEFGQHLAAYTAQQSLADRALAARIAAAGPAITYEVVAVIIAGLAIAMLIYSFSSALSRPLRLIGKALEAVGRGDLDHPLPSRMPAEFAPIVSGYQAMRAILSDRQRALALQLRRTSLLTQIAIELRDTLDPQTIIERVLRILGNNLGVDDAAIVLALPESAEPLGMRWAHQNLQPIDADQIAHMLAHGPEGRVMREQSNIAIADVSRAESWPADDDRSSGSVMVLVLMQNERTLGSLSVYNQHTNAFSHHDLLLLEGIVAQTSVALSLGLRFRAERQHSAQLEELVDRRTVELQRSRDLLRVMFDHLPEGLLLLSEAGEILAANNAFCRNIIGRIPRATVGLSYTQIWSDLAREAELTLAPQGRSESGVPILPPADGPFPLIMASWRVLSIDIVGQQRWYAVDRFPIYGAGGEPEQCLERWRDITQQEELQRQLLVHEQLSSLGRLAASIAHEVGNPLQSALSCLELCREDGGLSTNSREYLDLALGELDRMARTMASLRNLYRPPQIAWEQIHLNQLIRQVGQFTHRQLARTRVRLDLQLDEQLPPITGQPDALRQVLLNLVLNAQQAMAEGGEIQITTASKFTDRSCQITVRDTGAGMSADQLDHIFEPFRSLKAQGVGLGLYLSRQIIEQHTGHIEIASQLGHGTTITIQLPWSDAGPWRQRSTPALDDA